MIWRHPSTLGHFHILPIPQEARIYYFDNCPSAECHLAEVMQAVAREAMEARLDGLPKMARTPGGFPWPWGILKMVGL